MFSNLLTATELVGVGARICFQVCLPWNLCPLFLQCIPSVLLIVIKLTSVLRSEVKSIPGP